MAKFYGGFKDCIVDISRSTEFTGDDVDQYSELVDLLGTCDKLLIVAPALSASGTVSVYVQEGGSVATIPKALHYKRTADETTSAEWKTTSGAGDFAIVCDCLGAYRFIRLKVSATQTADRTFRVCGFGS